MRWWISFIAGYITSGFVIVIGNIIEKEPTAIEVYQRKTTLEYKIIDGEVVDSCVVYKQK